MRACCRCAVRHGRFEVFQQGVLQQGMFSDDNIAPGRKEAGPASGRPPAVLQVLPSLVSGGVERGAVDLAAALVEAGWTAYVASAGGPMEKELARVGAQHVTLPLASKNPLVIRRNRKALADLIRRGRIDIVHARSRAPAWSALSAARATGRRFVTTFHNAYDADLPFKHRYNAVMACGDRVIAISHFVAEHVAKVYGIGPDRLRTIPRGVDLARFEPDRDWGQQVAALALHWRVPDGFAVIMLPGRLTRWKGGLDSIEAIARLGRRDVCGVLVGGERAAFGRQARAQVGAGYTREIMCARTIEVYEELLFPETATVVVNRTQPMPAWHEAGPMSEMTDAQVGLS